MTDKDAGEKGDLLADRIVKVEQMSGSDLKTNDGNWRIHPQAQKDTLELVVDRVGKAGVLIAYKSERQGGLTLIDGEMRVTKFPDETWWVAVTDLTDEEADFLLQHFDGIGAMARADREKLEALERSAGRMTDDIKAELDLLALGELIGQQLAQAKADAEKGELDTRGKYLETDTVVRVALPIDGVQVFEQAVMMAGELTKEHHRGKAVIEIARFYLEQKGE